ncbi:DoxX family protein [Deinococcus frigens]|uniref:DoxX family protein n=1 Tax=Deinococcus frigens TaxID=249403 RepID=UPI00068C0440|nr:DoxX family membrane protein [Deinococcus frigens]
MRPQPEFALALIRVVVGLVFTWHGFHKVFELGLGSVTATYGVAGVPLPLLFAPLVAVLELVGGPLLVLGLGARGLAGALALTTAGVTLAPLLAGRLNIAALEVPVLLLAGSLAVMIGGSGSAAFRDRSAAVSPPARALSKGKRG